MDHKFLISSACNSYFVVFDDFDVIFCEEHDELIITKL